VNPTFNFIQLPSEAPPSRSVKRGPGGRRDDDADLRRQAAVAQLPGVDDPGRAGAAGDEVGERRSDLETAGRLGSP
jgi:hypothetical protein